jgi:YD repeat-containing protein
VRQSVPYTVTNGSGFQTLNLNRFSTYTLYDPLGRTLAITDIAGVAVHYVYKDLETRLKNGMGNTTRTLYDIWGRVTQAIPLNGDNNNSPAGPAISYYYDDLDRLTTVWQGTTISTTLTYDYAGRKTQMRDPDMGTWNYAYDYLGNLTQQADARGCVTTLAYDLLNRLTQKSFSGTCSGQVVSYYYDEGTFGKGQRTHMTDASGQTVWSYDARGQLMLETKTINGSIFATEWHYNSAGMLEYMATPRMPPAARASR